MLRPRDFALFAALILAAPPVEAAPAGFAFLEVPAGARAAAMGGAYVSLVEGVEGVFWNPAALAGVQGTQVTGGHTEFVQSLKHDQFALAGRLLGGGVAGSIRAMYTQPIAARDELGVLTGTWGSHDLEFQLGYGWTNINGLRFGLAGQVVRERIDTESAMTWSGGAGATWQPRGPAGLRLGVSAQHLGPAAHYDFDGERGAPVELPTAVQTGASWAHELAHGFATTVAVDARTTRGRPRVVGAGAELSSSLGAALRAGYRNGDDVTDFSAGIGYRRGGFAVDYAWVPARLDLGDTHRFSFAAQF